METHAFHTYVRFFLTVRHNVLFPLGPENSLMWVLIMLFIHKIN